MGKSRVKLTICGSDYIIVSDDRESYVRSVGDMVNDKINDILLKNPKLSISMASVLAALEYCDEVNKATEKMENFRTQIKDYVSEVSKYREKNEIAEIEINNLKNKIESLTKVIDKYKKEIDELNKKEIDKLNLNKTTDNVHDNSMKEIVTLSLVENEIADSI